MNILRTVKGGDGNMERRLCAFLLLTVGKKHQKVVKSETKSIRT